MSDFIPFILMIYVSGGWDTSMVFEYKGNSSYVSQESGAARATGAGNLPYVDHPDRPSVKAFFDARGANAAIVNGLSSGTLERTQAVRNIMGAVPEGKVRPVDWLSYYAASLNPVASLPHTIIDGPLMPGEYASVAVRFTSEMIDTVATAPAGAETLGDDGEKALAAFRKSTYAKSYEIAHGHSLDAEKLLALYYGYARNGLIQKKLSEALTELGDTSADTTFVRNGKLAVELFASGTSQCVTLQAGAEDEWNTQSGSHFATQSSLYESLFAGINAIMIHAAERDVLSKMIVMVVSERGRAPALNAAGGKDPWAFTSMLLWGAGIRGGTVAGLSDSAMRGLPVDPVFGGQTGTGDVTLEFGHVFSALYLKTGVPSKLLIPEHKPLSQILAVEASP